MATNNQTQLFPPNFSSERNWTDDYGHENGNYNCICIECGNDFIGHKRRVVCKSCALPQKIQWFAADGSKNTIAYGTIAANPKPTDNKSGRRDYKITYSLKYLSCTPHYKQGNSFQPLEACATLKDAQAAALNHLRSSPVKHLVKTGAAFSTCRKYRYALWRIWAADKPLVMFIGLNPSTANETEADNTIKRVTAISKNNGFGGFYMLNLFAFVTPYPKDLEAYFETELHNQEDEVNAQWLSIASNLCQAVVFAWGDFKVAQKKAAEIKGLFPEAKALHINKNGSPKHPLYCKKDSQLVPYT